MYYGHVARHVSALGSPRYHSWQVCIIEDGRFSSLKVAQYTLSVTGSRAAQQLKPRVRSW